MQYVRSDTDVAHIRRVAKRYQRIGLLRIEGARRSGNGIEVNVPEPQGYVRRGSTWLHVDE